MSTHRVDFMQVVGPFICAYCKTVVPFGRGEHDAKTQEHLAACEKAPDYVRNFNTNSGYVTIQHISPSAEHDALRLWLQWWQSGHLGTPWEALTATREILGLEPTHEEEAK